MNYNITHKQLKLTVYNNITNEIFQVIEETYRNINSKILMPIGYCY